MAILKTTLGYYIPTFFEMHVSTCKRPKTDLVI